MFIFLKKEMIINAQIIDGNPGKKLDFEYEIAKSTWILTRIKDTFIFDWTFKMDKKVQSNV